MVNHESEYNEPNIWSLNTENVSDQTLHQHNGLHTSRGWAKKVAHLPSITNNLSMVTISGMLCITD